MDKEIKPRIAVFGISIQDRVVCIHAPRNAEECGLYVHVDDIEKYRELEKQLEMRMENPDGKKSP